MTEDKPKTRRMHEAVACALTDLMPLFKHHELTFVARNLNPDLDGDVIITNDDLRKVVAVLLDHAARPETTDE